MIIALVAAPVLLAADAAATGGLPGWITSLLLPFILALGGGGGFYQLLKVRTDKQNLNAGTDKMKAEAADILADSAVTLLAPLREELLRLTEKVKEQQADIREMERTLAQERATSDTRIRQLESDIADRDREIFGLRREGL